NRKKRRSHMANNTDTPKRGVTRRKFLQYSAGASALLSASPLLRWTGGVAEAAHKQRTWETRTYFFNFSHFDTSTHDLILVAGKQRVKLTEVTGGALKQARKDHPILTHVPDAHFTHHIKLKMPANAIQLCYVQRITRSKKKDKKKGQSWD